MATRVACAIRGISRTRFFLTSSLIKTKTKTLAGEFCFSFLFSRLFSLFSVPSILEEAYFLLPTNFRYNKLFFYLILTLYQTLYCVYSLSLTIALQNRQDPILQMKRKAKKDYILKEQYKSWDLNWNSKLVPCFNDAVVLILLFIKITKLESLSFLTTFNF